MVLLDDQKQLGVNSSTATTLSSSTWLGHCPRYLKDLFSDTLAIDQPNLSYCLSCIDGEIDIFIYLGHQYLLLYLLQTIPKLAYSYKATQYKPLMLYLFRTTFQSYDSYLIERNVSDWKTACTDYIVCFKKYSV